MTCSKCFATYTGGLCLSATCVRNRKAEAERAAVRGTCGKSGVKDYDERFPSHEAPLDPVIYAEDPKKNKKCRYDKPHIRE